MVLRMALLLFAAMRLSGLGLFAIRRLRKSLVAEPESLDHAPIAPEGLPVHAYHAVIQQLKQQKHELAAQQLSERRKAKASDALSSTILSNLSCGVLFFNTSGLVRQANAAARKLLGFASPVGLHVSDLFRSATLRPEAVGAPPQFASQLTSQLVSQLASQISIEQALAPALAGNATVRGLVVNYFNREGGSQILEITASPVLAEDATSWGRRSYSPTRPISSASGTTKERSRKFPPNWPWGFATPLPPSQDLRANWRRAEIRR